MTYGDGRAYIDRLLEGDLEGARHHIDALLTSYSPQQIILDVLAPAQAEIGRRWEDNQCSVADEHVATSITDAVLAQLGAATPSPSRDTTFAVSCVEGDWHVVPARMAAELLRAEGYRVRFLGGSLPAEHLERYLAALQPAAMCLSCSLPLFLPGALRSVEAAHRAGIPVMAGGRGFGRDEHAALRVGADAWARTMTGATRQLAAWARNRPGEYARPFADTEAWSAIELARSELVDHTMVLLSESWPWMRDFDERQLARTREDLAYIFQFLAVSLLVDDDRIFVEFLVWLCGVLTSRNLPRSTVGATLPMLTKSLDSAGRLTPRVERLVRAGAGVLQTTGASKL
ncbi:MAG: B12-binding domain-containing protein [Actinomycetota bacterium]|nr:B12-binding domain-containing protein [Actinomycetota bacterium]MDQ6945820.1 B12-binding domain-containing protein [Actinomycetota bacterium]